MAQDERGEDYLKDRKHKAPRLDASGLAGC